MHAQAFQRTAHQVMGKVVVEVDGGAYAGCIKALESTLEVFFTNQFKKAHKRCRNVENVHREYPDYALRLL